MIRVQDAEILAFISHYHEKNGFAPSIREVQAATGLKSTASIAYRLDSLRRKGKLFRRPGLARTLKVQGGA